MAKIDRSILQANDQSMGQYGDPDKIESSITHLADKIDENDNGFNSHKDASELAHPDKSVTERKLADEAATSRVLGTSSVLANHLDPSLLLPLSNAGTQAEFDLRAVNVKKMGAKGDGVADDTAAIQAAYDSVPNGGRVFFPDGNYLISSTITINSKNVISYGGSKYYKPRLFTKTPNITMFKAIQYGIVFRDLLFEGDATLEGGTDGTAVGIEVGDGINPNLDEFTLENCTMVRFKRGLIIKTRNFHIRTNVISWCLEGIVIPGIQNVDQFERRNYNIINNRLHVCHDVAIKLEGVHSEVNIQGNMIDRCGRGIQGYCEESLIANNIISKCKKDGIYIDNTNLAAYHLGVTIVNNLINGWRADNTEIGHGIYVKADHANIKGNEVTRKAYAGIELVGQRGIVANNYVRDCDFYDSNTYSGISVKGSNNLIEGNWSGNAAAGSKQIYGIFIEPTTTGNILGVNFLLNNKTGQMNPVAQTTYGLTEEGLSRKLQFGYLAGAAPTTGTWNRGDIILNKIPSASGKVGWICTVAGTPGTWKPFGPIDA